ncbi:hypothetical protein ABPG75_009542 [Micractinium tetrahymenae]
MSSASALALYRKLWRLTRSLPRQVQPYYRNNIRSGFVAFRDEDDEETLQRISEQCQRDAEWVLQKYKTQPRERRK